MHPLIEKAKREGRHLLEPEVLSLLEEYGIQVPRHVVVHNKDEAVKASKSLGYPVVMKVVSPGIIHKTEQGGVILGLQNAKQVTEAVSRLSSLESSRNKIEGFVIYPFQPHDVELSAGMVRDPQFGPVITFGLGGIWIEVFRDIAFGIAPLSMEEAGDMLASIKAHSILEGLRKKTPADREALCKLLVGLSRMAIQEDAIQEIDLNPVFPLDKGCFIADGRIIL